MSEHHFITGVAGFIGSHLADALLLEGCSVSGVDDLSLGCEENLHLAMSTGRFHLERGDLRETAEAERTLRSAIEHFGPVERVWHLAANSDIAAGVADARIDLGRTLLTTFSVIEACKTVGVSRVAFASTSAVYGENDRLLVEDSGPLLPISNYGATKLASEALLSAAAESHLERIWIFRFPNVVGSRATHGAIHDFVKRLRDRPAALRVLGDGTQRKPYLHVGELVSAMRRIVNESHEKRNVFNIGPEGGGSLVSFLALETIARVAPGTPIEYGGGDRGWIGDVPRFRYSTEKLKQLGWSPRLSSDDAVRKAIAEIAFDHGF